MKGALPLFRPVLAFSPNKTKAGKPKPAKSKRAKFCRIADRVKVFMVRWGLAE